MLNFPSNPIENQIFEINGSTYKWYDGKWSIVEKSYSIIHKDLGSNINAMDFDLLNSRSAYIELDNNIETQLSIINPTAETAKLNLFLEKNNYSSGNIDKSSYDGKSYSFLGQITTPSALWISSDGKKIFVVDTSNNIIHRYSTKVAYDFKQAIYDNMAYSIGGVITSPTCIAMSDDGLRFYVSSSASDIIYQLELTVPWDLNTMTYNGNNFNFSTQGTNAVSFAIADNGNRLYIMSNTNKVIYQYTMSVPYNITTSIYQVQTFSVAAQDSNARDIFFSPNGNTFFMLGNTAPIRVFQYNLSNNWNLNSTSYSNSLFNINAQDSAPRAIHFKPDGTNFYTVGSTTRSIYVYALSDPWNIISTLYDNFSYNLGIQETSPQQIFIRPDGKKMYMIGLGGDNVYQYTFTIPWDISTITYDNVRISIGNQEANPTSLYFKNDGTKLYIIGLTGDRIYQYSLKTPWDVSTLIYDSFSTAVLADTNPTGLFFRDDGLVFYIVGTTNDTVYQYSLSNPWDITSSITLVGSFSVIAQDGFPDEVFFNKKGTKMYILGGSTGRIYQYTLSIAWNVATASYDNLSFLVNLQDSLPRGMFFNDEASRFYMVGVANRGVYQYSTSNRQYDLSRASYDNVSYFFAQDSDVTGFYIRPDGKKLYAIGRTNNVILQYSFLNAWDFSSLIYDNVFFFINSQQYTPFDLQFLDDGTIAYLTLRSDDVVIYKYQLSVPWNISTAQRIEIIDNIRFAGETVYTTPGTYTWVAPPNVTQVSVVCVGGGSGAVSSTSGGAGGGGGALAWRNNIQVTPGQSYTVVVGVGGAGASGTAGVAGAGGTSYFSNINVISATGGSSISGFDGQSIGGTFIGDGGGNGGNGGLRLGSTASSPGGGGAGGYTGNGGTGASGNSTIGGDGTGGAGGGGGSGTSSGSGGGGGGVGIFGLGSDGLGGAASTRGGGGSGGTGGTVTTLGGVYGGGAGASDASATRNGASGVVRIIWGPDRSFPNNKVYNYNLQPTTVRILFNNDGTVMYTIGFDGSIIEQYSLQDAYDISTAVYDNKSYNINFDLYPTDIQISRDGKKLFILGTQATQQIYQLTLTTPWDISTAVLDNINYSLPQDARAFDFQIDPSGTKIYVLGDINNRIYTHTIDILSPSINWKNNIIWDGGNAPLMPDVNTTDSIELYTIDKGETYYGLKRFNDNRLNFKDFYQNVSQSISQNISPGLYTLGTYIGQNNNYTFRLFDLTPYVGRTVRFVWNVLIGTDGDSWSNDVQLDNINIGSTNYNFETGNDGFQTSPQGANPIYSNITWQAVATSTTSNGTWNRNSGNTPSTGTGNLGAQSGSFYIYSEATSPVQSGHRLWVRSPSIVLNSSNMSFYEGRQGLNSDTILSFYIQVVS